MMKKLFAFAALAAALALTACGNNGRINRKAVMEADTVDVYTGIVSFLEQGFRCRWDGMSPEDRGLSYVYSYNSEYAGYAVKDINGDGVKELLIGDRFEDGSYDLYDIYTVNPEDGAPVHLATGGERDRFMVNGAGVITEYGSNSAADSFCKGFVIRDGRLEEVHAWDDDVMAIEFEHFEKQ